MTERRVLAVLGVGELLAMAPWFSTSAVAPTLMREWDLDAGAIALPTISVQLGFVAGALTSAVLTLSDRWSGTGLTLQTSLGFLLTCVTISALPMVAETIGWRWSMSVLALGPALGVGAMLGRRRRPEAAQLAGGRG